MRDHWANLIDRGLLELTPDMLFGDPSELFAFIFGVSSELDDLPEPTEPVELPPELDPESIFSK